MTNLRLRLERGRGFHHSELTGRPIMSQEVGSLCIEDLDPLHEGEGLGHRNADR